MPDTPSLQIRLFFFQGQKELLGLLSLCLIPPTAEFLPETWLKPLILERYLIFSVRLQAVASHPSWTVLVKQWWASSRDFRFGFGAAPRLHILAQSLSGKLRPLEPGGLSVRANVNRLLPCMAAQKLLCHFSCVFGHWVEQYTWAFGKDRVQVVVFYTRCWSSAWSTPFPCASSSDPNNCKSLARNKKCLKVSLCPFLLV